MVSLYIQRQDVRMPNNWRPNNRRNLVHENCCQCVAHSRRDMKIPVRTAHLVTFVVCHVTSLNLPLQSYCALQVQRLFITNMSRWKGVNKRFESRITDAQIVDAVSFTRNVACVLHTYAGVWKYLCEWLFSLQSWFVTSCVLTHLRSGAL